MAAHQDHCEICRRIGRARSGDDPALIAETDTGFAVMGDSQFFRGYCVHLCKDPATEWHELPRGRRLRYLEETAQLAEAVAAATRPHKINYECLGNQVPHLHFHVFPRRLTDPDPSAPVWGQMPTGTDAAGHAFDPRRDGGLVESIRRELSRVRVPG
ncbi:MAG: HIT family protein [Phycisphaeraceae bacterium]|nr:MAG: HIT family protein [Phycisphaeraceae bacterium]